MTTSTDDARAWLALDGAPTIPGLRFRRARLADEDFTVLAVITGVSNRADDIPYLPSAHNLREEFDDLSRSDPAKDLVIAEVDGVPVADAGIDRVVRAGVAVYETWGHVDPAWRRRGLGRALLRENLRRIRERGAAEPDGVPFEARAHVDEREAGHHRLVADAGFEPIRWFFMMRRPTLDEIPDTPLPDDLEFRAVTPDLHRRIWEADNEAFRDHWQAREPEEGDFTSLFAKADLDTSLWAVAWDGEEIAGVVQPWIWKEENRELGVQRGWIEHISVRRPWRRRGLGRALTAEGLRRLRAAGMKEAMLGVDAENPTGALGVYERLGFEVHQRTTAYALRFER